MKKYQYINPVPSVDENEITKEPRDDIGVNDYLKKKSVYFAFIDILGFKKAFDDNRNSKDYKFEEKFRNVFNYFFELMNAANFMKDKECYAGQTSDSLYFYTSRPDMLLEFLKLFSHFNLYAMAQNVFFRGGVAKGNLFCKQKYQFYGDSVIYAYLLESVIAKNPAIYIDENTYCDLNKYDNCDDLLHTNKERYYMRPFAGFKINPKLYVNEYFAINIRETPLDIIQKNIETNKKEFEYDAKNFEKYVFLIKELEIALNKDIEKKVY